MTWLWRFYVALIALIFAAASLFIVAATAGAAMNGNYLRAGIVAGVWFVSLACFGPSIVELVRDLRRRP